MQAEAEHRRSDGDPQKEINLARENNQIATVLNSIHQFKIQAHRLNRRRSAHEINKHVSDGVYKRPAENKLDFDAKDFSKSEVEFVDVKDTLQTLFQTLRDVERDGQESYILAEGNRHTEHEQRHRGAHK